MSRTGDDGGGRWESPHNEVIGNLVDATSLELP